MHPVFQRALKTLLVGLALISFSARAADKPNVVLIFIDDQGYNDLSCFGSTKINTPHIDRMAEEGRKFTNFLVASPVCSPSRAGLLTGCYPKRVSMHKGVLFPNSTHALNPEETTIADILKAEGYATACVGKWHLGHHKETLPMQFGFDSYYGIPYSNDMNHPANKDKPKSGVEGMDELWADPESTLTKWQTPLMENEEIVELPVDQRTITRRYTDRGIDFIKDNKDDPFFLYLPHSMPHIPLYVPDEVQDKNPLNAYTNTIEHIDAQVGRVMDTIREEGLAENTLVIYTTDNGPWLRFEHHGGSALPLREGKGTTFEGGQRVPCIMWAPGRIPAGTEYDGVASSIDLLPTLAKLTGAELPEAEIDGLDLSEQLSESTPSPRAEFLYYASGGQLEGLRQGQHKLLIKTRKKNKKDTEGVEEVMLFDLAEDISESVNMAEEKPEIVAQLRQRMLDLDNEIAGEARENWLKPVAEESK